jgi:hypothetical protein
MILKLGFVKVLRASRRSESVRRARGGQKKQDFLRDFEIARLKSKVGEITMDNELLYAKIAVMEGKRPLAHRRSRR